MARVKRGTISRKRHKKLHELTIGYRGTRNRLVKVAKEASLHAGSYAFHGRKRRKRDFRELWITRIGEAAKQEGVSYSVFIHRLKKANVELDRKILSELVLKAPEVFKRIVQASQPN